MIPIPPFDTPSTTSPQQQQVIILNTNIPSIPSLPSLPSLPSFPTLQSLQSQLLLSSIQQSLQQHSPQIVSNHNQTLRSQQRCIEQIYPSQPTLFTVNNLNQPLFLPQNPQPQTIGISQPNSSVVFITIPSNNYINTNDNYNMNTNYGCTNMQSMLCTNNNAVVNAPKEEDSLPPEVQIDLPNDALDPKLTVSKRIQSKTDSHSYQCQICHKRFKYQSNLISHRRVHRVDCPKCSYCGKKFARKSNLLQHIRIHTNERPYKCTYCPKAFKQKHSLTDHIRSHTGERPFSCEICLKSFAVKHNLIVHKRIHSGEKPYACHLCNTNYSSKSGINSHLKHRHPELWAERKMNKIKKESK